MDELDPLEKITFENAIKSTKFGKFNIFLLLICGAIFANTAMGVTMLSFVLPAAACDFDMNSQSKGALSGAPMMGMLVGSYFWGCMADIKGRRFVLVTTLLIDGICGLVSSFIPIYSIFLTLRLINGFSIAGTMGICFSYLGEFQQTKYRETVLGWMELFWAVGVICLPLIAWGIIPMEICFKYLKSWNIFVLIGSLPSVLIGLLLIWFPESPKFLVEVGEPDKALDILKKIYELNTGNSAADFPVRSLQPTLHKFRRMQKDHRISIRQLKVHKKKDMKILLGTVWDQTKELLHPPLLKLTLLTCYIQFGILTSYYTLMIWFPELFNRLEKFEVLYPNDTVTMCAASKVVVDQSICQEHIEDEVFIHTLLVGLACIPSSIWLPSCMYKLGVRFFLMFSLIVSCIATILLYFVQNLAHHLMLSCLFESMTSLAESAIYCVLVEIFPTRLRVMASSLSLTVGRLGGVLGNALFGYLIDIQCEVPIVIFAALLLTSGILCFFLPHTGQKSLN
uniref:CSON011276 protein n=1 Tax=Culicoides sonorensis TaxID=179676 RepID=A0A336M5U0_CULSO